MAKKGNQGQPSKTSPGKSGKKSTPGKIKMGADAGFAAIAAIRAGVPISEVTAKARSQTGFVNPPSTPAGAPNPAASAPPKGGYTQHFTEAEAERAREQGFDTPYWEKPSRMARLKNHFASTPNPAASAPAPGGYTAPAPSHFQSGMQAVLAPSQSVMNPRDMHGRQMDEAARMLNGEPNRPGWKTEGYAPTSAWSEGARAAGRAFDRMRDEKIRRADVDEAYGQAKVMDKAWSRNRHAETQAARQVDREEAKIQEDVARRGAGRDDGGAASYKWNDVTGALDRGRTGGDADVAANIKMKELAGTARGRQQGFFSGHRDATVIRRGLIAAMAISQEMKPINTAAYQLEPFLKLAEYGGYLGGPVARLGVFAGTSIARGIASWRESRWDAVQSRIDVHRMLNAANDPMAELFANKIAPERAIKSQTILEWAAYNIGFTNILDADIKKQTSDRIASYNSTKGNLAAYGIDFATILAKYAADRGIPIDQVSERERAGLLSETLNNLMPTVVGGARKALYDTNEIEEMMPFFHYGSSKTAIREKNKQTYFDNALQGNTRYGDDVTDYKDSQAYQRRWWASNSPEFRRKFDVDTRESQQQAKAIRKRHTQGF